MFSRSSSSITFFFIVSLLAVLINPAISSRASSSFTKHTQHSSIASNCESWRLASETNNAGSWKVVPSRCVNSVKNYITGGQFENDYNIVARYAIAYAKRVKLGGDGKDAWVFDIDETLLSNLEYYKALGYGSEPYDDTKFNEWAVQGKAPAFDASLKLYKALKRLGFTIILLTGRDESQRSVTAKNLRDAGYFGWNRLLLRGKNDQGKTATQYKSEQRSKVVKEGYKIHGSTGDQWSDLQGFAVAARSFKVPNPMYYIA
ncbi:PREDICTED: acid phosphatase 1-like [Camelina sativa]|uniref:Acid phosphatase 1-like n=1 Tax=Camelina sativa TaxID=90675 RepID=A0ABM0TY42_CAMSA|nr:PREDICTED: acid phosphatase 1-like [Camelina sativa]